MKLVVGVVIAVLVFSMGAALISSATNHHANITKGITERTVTISVHISHFKCDPNLDTIGKPDPYFVVFINQKEIKSKVWDGEDDFSPDWTATTTLKTRDPVVWIEISAWDKDSGLYGRDDLIDIDPGDGFSLDLIYNINTHSWAGDVTGTSASGNRPYDWGEIQFDITSTTGTSSNVNLPYSGFGRLDPEYGNSEDTYIFNANGDVNIYMEPNPSADYALYLYNSAGNMIASSNGGGMGAAESISKNLPSGQYRIVVKSVSGYGEYYLSINGNSGGVVNAQYVEVHTEKAYLLSKDWANINIRMMGYHVHVTLYNPTSTAGYVRVHFLNIDPDYMITNFENSTTRGEYSLTVILHLNSSETKSIYLHPWYEPKNDFWIFAMGDNRPGCGIYDHPYEQGPEYTLFTHYYTDVIRTPIGWDDGDLVAGFGGSLVTEWKGLSLDALDYVYEMEYNRLYMLTGTHDSFFFTSIGNHDVSRHYDQPQHEGEHIYEEYLGNLYYSFDFSNTHFVFPDDYQDGFWHHGQWTFGSGETPWWYATDPGSDKPTAHYGGYIYGDQLQWLKNDLASAQSKTHRIVVMHMPLKVPPSRKENLNDEFINYTNRLQVMNIFEKYHVDYLVVAHIHNYTYYYTNLDTVNGTLNVTTSMHPEGKYSVFTLLTGGAGAHNNYEWLVPAIEGSYHFVLIHVQGDSISYKVYKYENLTDSNGNPLTTVSYEGSNDGTETSESATIHNGAIYSFPYIRLKFKLSNDGSNYVAYSNSYGSYEKVYQHKFKDYTVVYVESYVGPHSDNTVSVHSAPVPEFPPLTIPLVVLLVIVLAIGIKRKR